MQLLALTIINLQIYQPISYTQDFFTKNLSALNEEEQIAIAIHMSMQCSEMEEVQPSISLATSIDDSRGSPLLIHSDVCISFLSIPHSFFLFLIEFGQYA